MAELTVVVRPHWPQLALSVLVLTSQPSPVCPLQLAKPALHEPTAQAERLGVGDAPLYLLAETCLERVLEEMARLKPALVIVDSIQTVYIPQLESSAGSVGQVRECATQLLFTSDVLSPGPTLAPAGSRELVASIHSATWVSMSVAPAQPAITESSLSNLSSPDCSMADL